MEVGGSLNKGQLTFDKLHYGRQRIILDYPEITSENLFEVMQKALGMHNQNARDCDYLIHYFLGKQDILDRIGGGTSNINNKTVVNFAFPITREIVGYTYGSPTEFIPKDMKYQKEKNHSKISDIRSPKAHFSHKAADTSDIRNVNSDVVFEILAFCRKQYISA